MPAPQYTTSPVDTPQVTAPVGHNGIRVDSEERPAWRVDGILAAVLATILTILALGDAIALARNAYFSDHDNFTPWLSFSLLLALLLGAIAVTIWASLDAIKPGEAVVIQFLGRYIGTVCNPGLNLVVPFAQKTSLSVRAANFQTETLKVNERQRQPHRGWLNCRHPRSPTPPSPSLPSRRQRLRPQGRVRGPPRRQEPSL